jgi:hypothetical protein
MGDGMNDQFLSTVQPYKIDPERWWSDKPIDPASLKPDTGNKNLLIIGDGRCVLDDLEAFFQLGHPADIMTMNFSPKVIPECLTIHNYIAGDSHTPSMQKVAGQMPPGVLRHCWNQNSKNFDIRWGRNTSKPWNGTTANLGVKIGIALGYLRIILAGCPMDNSGNWYRDSLPENDIKRGKDHTAHLWKWTEIASRPIGRFIRSMSGNTARLLGEPTKEWLENL